MTPERMASLVGRWVRYYTRGLPAPVAARRIEEIEADLVEQIGEERAAGVGERRIALGILSRMARGMADDHAWRNLQRGGSMDRNQAAYRSALALAVGAALFLAWGVAAMGVVGAEGDPIDLLYFGVLAVGIVGSLVVRFRPSGMVRVLLAMALAQAAVAVVALLAGRHESPVSSVAEIVGLNGLYVALFLGSAWLFRRASRADAGGADGSMA